MGEINLFLFVVFVTMLNGLNSQNCNLAPSLWCSSPEISRNCQVEEQCFNYYGKSRTEVTKVKVGLYYEALCPDCKVWIQEQLWPTYKTISSIFDLELVPYGNAEETLVNNDWVFTCQHGSEECFGNIIETCALNKYPNINQSFPFIYCMESSDKSVKASFMECAEKHDLIYDTIYHCTQGKDGRSLEHKMALKTDALVPQHEYVPWITLNDVHNDDIQDKASSDLLGLVCETYQGPKPQACNRAPKRNTETNHVLHWNPL